jgi:hypothetical protein
MSIFAIKRITDIDGSIPFFKMVVNGVCEFDEFEAVIKNEGNYSKELIRIQTRMQELSEGKMLPINKFKPLSKSKDWLNEYEIKTKNLRVYLFHEPGTGRIIICGGKKSNQGKDIHHFRSILNSYIHRKI